METHRRFTRWRDLSASAMGCSGAVSVTSSLKYIESELDSQGASFYESPSPVNDQEWKKIVNALPVEIPSGVAELYSVRDALPD